MSVGKTKGKERLTGISKLEDANEAGRMGFASSLDSFHLCTVIERR